MFDTQFDLGTTKVVEPHRSVIDEARALDDYIEDDFDASMSVKTPGSRRVIPIHDRLKALGFDRYVTSIRESGSVQLFPDLVAGKFGKHTKEASRVANRLIDKLVTRNRRFAFHSFRHQFKDFALDELLPVPWTRG